jgi:ABC-type polysaccharide/polyol phosphate export permease
VGSTTAFAVALQDVAGSFSRLTLAARLAFDDIHGRYRRTVLGPLWITIGQAATIAGFLIVFSGLFGIDPGTYALYLAAGFPVWILISQFLADMPLAFVNARGLIESFGLPWTLQIWRRSIGYSLIFFHHLVVLLAVMAFQGAVPRLEMLLALPALAIVIVAGTGLGILLALLGARYRDMQPAMSTATGMLFMFSPVMWKPEQLRINEWAYEYNPLYYYITLVREPLLGRSPAPELWLWTGLGAIMVLCTGIAAYSLARHRLYHWL